MVRNKPAFFFCSTRSETLATISSNDNPVSEPCLLCRTSLINPVNSNLVKFGYMVDRRSIIFSKLFDGRALSGAAATAPPVARLPATRGCSPPTAAAVAAGAAAPAGGGAAAKGTPALVIAVLVGTGGSGVELLLSGEGWC